MRTPRDEVLLTTVQAARFLGMSEGTVIRWSNLGRIPCVRTGAGHRRFRLGDLETVLTTGEADAPSRPVPPQAAEGSS